jgi:TerC family integral membrane protein
MTAAQGWAWVGAGGAIAVLLAVDLLVIRGQPRMRTAVGVSIAWVAAAAVFGLLLIPWLGAGTGQEFFAAYLVERALSVDNLFVFALLIHALAVPVAEQNKVLTAGILGALVLRGAFIAAGAALLDNLGWALYAFGVLLLVAAVRTARGGPRSAPLAGLRKRFPVRGGYVGLRLLTRDGGRLSATPLLVALVAIATTDVIFAIDSIPAALGVTTDMFVLFTSNAFAVLGLRPLYFVLAGAMARFSYLSQGLAVLLAFIGLKMMLTPVVHVPAAASLGVVAAIVAAAILLSLWQGRRARPEGSAVRPGQRHQHPGAPSRGAGHVDQALVRADQFGDDGEADAAAGDAGGRLAAPEPVEDQRKLGGGDAGPGVGHPQLRPVAGRPGRERHPPAGRGELEGVPQQVHDDLPQPRGVRQDRDGG